tara:strand:+ start:16 stop:753 length:738 start_codon:yes stop_codon:yes gene_type:complete
MKNIFFTGTAGSGKSQLTSILSNWYQQEGKDVITVNLDPGVNNLPYGVDVDIRDYINLKDIMEKYNLGPNGSLILASDLIATKLEQIENEIDEYNPDYVFIDTPGQIELFAYRTSGPYLVKNMKNEANVNIFLFDSTLVKNPSNFISIALLGSSIKLRLKIPQISILTKTDLIPENNKLLKWADDFSELLDDLKEDGETYDLTSRIIENVMESDILDELIPVSTENNQGIVELVASISRIIDRGE